MTSSIRRILIRQFQLFGPTILAISVTACQPAASQKPQKISSSTSSGMTMAEHQIEDFSLITEIIGSGTWTNIFWLNFDGADVSAQDSFIVKNAGFSTVRIPAFDATDLGDTGLSGAEVKEALVAKISAVYQDFDISFVTHDPGTGSVIHIGGSDFRADKDALGVAPLDRKNFKNRDIGFGFPKTLQKSRGRENIDILAAAIAHEIGHSLGCSHIKNDTALMNSIVDKENFQLTSGDLVPGPGRENTQDILRQNIGKSADRDTSTLPTITNLGVDSQGSVIQYSVYTAANLEQNPNINLGRYHYTWKAGQTQVEGSNARFPAANREGSLALTVSNGQISKTFEFSMSLAPKLVK